MTGIQLNDAFFFVACLLLAAVFTAAETALFALVDARVHDIVKDAGERRQRARSLLRLWLERPDHVLTAILLGKHTAHVVLVLSAAIAIDDAKGDPLHSLPRAMLAVAVVVAVIVTVELFARAFAKTRAAFVAPTVFPVVVAAYVVTWPLVMVFTRLSRLFSRVAGGSVTRSGPFVTEQDIVEMIALGRRSGTIDKVEGRMLASIIELGDTLVKEVMVPRADISSLATTSSWDEVMAEVKEQGHSRVPIYDGTLDDINGFLHTKDLLTGDIDPKTFRLRDHLRPVEFVPEVMRVADLLRLFQKKKTHLAVVVDDFGGTAGIVALEDVLEEIVGPIHDEHDEEDAPIKRLSDTHWSAEGRVSLYDLGEVLHLQFPDGGYETLGGFLIARCGRMPRKGDRVSYSGFTFLVTDADERKVSRIDVERNPQIDRTGTTQPPGDADGTSGEGDAVTERTEKQAPAPGPDDDDGDDVVGAPSSDISGEGAPEER
jgi:CBS domain containing-hemolysin-like protein